LGALLISLILTTKDTPQEMKIETLEVNNVYKGHVTKVNSDKNKPLI